MPRAMIAPALAAALALAAGCDGGPKTYPVKGRVVYKGKPVPNGTVTFVPAGDAPAATGQLGPDGTYELTTFKPGDGAVPGRHTVMVVAVQDQGNRLPEDRSPLPPPIVPARYMNNATSGLTADVRAEPNTIDFELADEKPGARK